ncbi:hypothetical protein LMH73_021885 [Vibrio splendidus]|nr:hypothetical protein [Vibrio splendidus]MCC4880492.1 hypothetical protein [Vibrio splendidus]
MSESKDSGFGLSSVLLTGGLVGTMLISLCSLFEDGKKNHDELRGGSDSGLISEARNQTVSARSFSVITECENINTKEFSSSRSMTRYKEFNENCNYIWNKAESLLLNGEKMAGVSIINGFRMERYYPLLKVESGDISYPGGYPATLDYTYISQEDIKKLNASLKSYGIK